MVDGTTEMGLGGGAEDLVRVDPRVDRLDAQEANGHKADECTQHDTRPTREHQSQEPLAVYPIDVNQFYLSNIIYCSRIDSDDKYRGDP